MILPCCHQSLTACIADWLSCSFFFYAATLNTKLAETSGLSTLRLPVATLTNLTLRIHTHTHNVLHTADCVLKPSVEGMKIRAQAETKTTQRTWSSCYVQGSTRWVAKHFYPNLRVISVAKKTEVRALAIMLTVDYRDDGRDKKVQRNVQINTFH